MIGTREQICSALKMHPSRFYALVGLGDITPSGFVPREPGAKGRAKMTYRVKRKSLLKGLSDDRNNPL